MKMLVWATLRFTALHKWEGAKIMSPSTSYLSYLHRHEFHVKIKWFVNHDDRDIEFIKAKNEVDAFIHAMWEKKDLGEMSCEQMCITLLKQFKDAVYVSVSEDGENGAEVFSE